MATSSAGLAAIAGAVFIGNGLWSWAPSWHTVAPAQREIRVQSPVSDSVIASVNCNCHCQDNLVVVASAYVCGILTALFQLAVIRCWWIRGSAECAAPAPLFEQQGGLDHRPRLAILSDESDTRRKAVIPSSRRR